MKIKIVYNYKTGEIPRHIWEEDGTVSILGSVENLIVSMVEPIYVDFDNFLVLLEEMNAKKEKSRSS